MNTNRLTEISPRLRRQSFVVLHAFVLGLIGWTMAGCQHSQTSQERAAHREPANRPADLATAWQQLQTEQEEIDAGLKSPDPRSGVEESSWPERRARIAELVDWLPELAADSDLSESRWQEVQTAAASFSSRLAGSAGRRSITADDWQRIDLAELLRQIEPVLRESDRARTQLHWLSESP